MAKIKLSFSVSSPESHVRSSVTTGLVAAALDSGIRNTPSGSCTHSPLRAGPSPGRSALPPGSPPEARLSLLLQQLCSPFSSPSRLEISSPSPPTGLHAFSGPPAHQIWKLVSIEEKLPSAPLSFLFHDEVLAGGGREDSRSYKLLLLSGMMQ